MAESEPRLLEMLLEAQRRGFIGPGPLTPHVAHARALAVAVGNPVPQRVVDLGSGGGLPGLVLGGLWPTSALTLLDANKRRCAFLRWAVDQLGLGPGVVVDNRRAEEVGRDARLRGGADLVVARAFARPAVTAECAAPLLDAQGLLVVSEPPDVPEPPDTRGRWPVGPLQGLGLIHDAVQVPGFVRLRQATPCPERFPRRVGVPAKRPLF